MGNLEDIIEELEEELDEIKEKYISLEMEIFKIKNEGDRKK